MHHISIITQPGCERVYFYLALADPLTYVLINWLVKIRLFPLPFALLFMWNDQVRLALAPEGETFGQTAARLEHGGNGDPKLADKVIGRQLREQTHTRKRVNKYTDIKDTQMGEEMRVRRFGFELGYRGTSARPT